jgi:hypothetical protein
VAEQALLMRLLGPSYHFMNVEQVISLVQESRLIAVTDTSDMLDIGCGFAYSIIRKDFRYHKICAWYQSSSWAHVKTYMQFLQCYCEGGACLQWIVMGDETWMHYCEAASICQSMELKPVITQE